MTGDTLNWPSIITIISFLLTWITAGILIGKYKERVDQLTKETEVLQKDLAKKQDKEDCSVKHDESTGIAREFAQTVSSSFTRLENRFEQMSKDINSGLASNRTDMNNHILALRSEMNSRMDTLTTQILEIATRGEN